MDYTDPADRRDQPTRKLSPEEVEIAAQNYQAAVLKHINDYILGLPSSFFNPSLNTNPTTNEKEDPSAHN